MILEELLISLGYELDPDTLKELNKFGEGIMKAVKRFAAMIAIAVAATAAVVAFVAAVSQSTDALGKSAERIGIAVAQLNALQFAAEIATGSANGLEGSLESLSDTIQQFKLGGGAGAGQFGFGFIGFAPKEGEQLADTLVRISALLRNVQGLATRRIVAKNIGLGPLFLLLEQGPDQIRQLVTEAKALGVVTAEDTRIAAEFNDQFFRVFGFLIRQLKVFTASRLAPGITAIVTSITDWIRANKELIKQNLADAAKAIGEALSIVFDIVKIGLKSLAVLIKLVGGLGNAIRILITLFGLLIAAGFVALITTTIVAVQGLIAALAGLGITIGGILAVAAPIAAILALIIIIALAVEDFVGFLQGKDSFFEKLIDRFFLIEKALKPISEIMLFMENSIRALVDLLSNPLDATNWKNFFRDIEKEFTRFGNVLLDNPLIADLIIPNGGYVSQLAKLGMRAFGQSSGTGTGSGRIQLDGMTGAAGIGVGSGVNQTNNVKVYVNGGDPEAMKRTVGKVFTDAARKAFQDLNSGVAK